MTIPSGQGPRVGQWIPDGAGKRGSEDGTQGEGRASRGRGTWCLGQAEPTAYGLSLDTDGAYPRVLFPESPGGENLDRYAVGDWS